MLCFQDGSRRTEAGGRKPEDRQGGQRTEDGKGRRKDVGYRQVIYQTVGTNYQTVWMYPLDNRFIRRIKSSGFKKYEGLLLICIF